MGRQLLHYLVGDKIGEGGMGVVYQGTDTRLRRAVALKFLTKVLPAEAAERKRFLREAQAASAINHPNVCTIYSIEEVEGEEFIVMEFIEGLTLRRWGAKRRAELHSHLLPEKDILALAIQVAEGLDAAHNRGIVHRDVKPENVMVMQDGRAKIMDFGLAKMAGASQLTREGATVGTVAYMSPEQVQSGAIDSRTDLYSFGVLLYELLTGMLPFQAEHVMGMMFAIVNSEPKPPRELRPHLDGRLERIVTKCIEKDRNARYGSMREVIAELAAYEAETKTITSPTRQGATEVLQGKQKGRVFSFMRKHALPLALSGAVIVVVLIALTLREHPSPEAILTIRSAPTGSAVWINGKNVGTTPLEALSVPAGRTTVHLSHASFAPVDTLIALGAEQVSLLDFTLRPAIQPGEGSESKTEGKHTASRGSDTSAGASVKSATSGPSDLFVDLARSLVFELIKGRTPLRGSVEVLPFTFHDTGARSKFSEYFKGLMEARLDSMGISHVTSGEDVATRGTQSAHGRAAYELTGTYREEPRLLRFVAELTSTAMAEPASHAEGTVTRDQMRELGMPWNPQAGATTLQQHRVKPSERLVDLKFELLTNKGSERVTVTEGDTLKSFVRVNQPCTVRIFYHTVDGTHIVLTGPNDMRIDTPNVGRLVLINSSICSEPFGDETLQGFATRSRFEPIHTRLVDNLDLLQDNLANAMTATRAAGKSGLNSSLVEKRVAIKTVSR